MTKRSHRGIADLDRTPAQRAEMRALAAASQHPVDFDPARKVCRTCGRRAMWVRTTYGPNARKGHAQHVGDGLAQYQSWR